VNADSFNKIIDEENTLLLELKSQMRVKGGNNYIQFVHDLLHVKRTQTAIYREENYELKLFENFSDLHQELIKKENQFGLCRMIAGYSWPWLSNPKLTPKPAPDVTDIDLDGLKFKWNSTEKDWINSQNAFNEIGCIHTTQGYDLNYTAVIFGKEINYNKITKRIEIDSKKYFDLNGKKGIVDPESLKDYIINIYKTIMYRGIKGTFIYACNKELREYLSQHIETFRKQRPFRILRFDEVKPYVNAIPLVDISAAAGNFSELQVHSELTWVEPPFIIGVQKGYFICQVFGESMNKKIPNGSYCLFKRDEGGSRNGKIVLVESTNINDSEFGSGYTVKEYQSSKSISEEEWSHESITLKPLSDRDEYNKIVLGDDDINDFRVVGIFVSVLI